MKNYENEFEVKTRNYLKKCIKNQAFYPKVFCKLVGDEYVPFLSMHLSIDALQSEFKLPLSSEDKEFIDEYTDGVFFHLFSIPFSLVSKVIISRSNGQKHYKKRKFNLPLSIHAKRLLLKYEEQWLDSDRVRVSNEVSDTRVRGGEVLDSLILQLNNIIKLAKANPNDANSLFQDFKNVYIKYLNVGGKSLNPNPKKKFDLLSFFLDKVFS